MRVTTREAPSCELLEAAHGVASGRRLIVRGTVQGVGFRPWVYRLAHELGIRGRVENGPAGVAIEDALVCDHELRLPQAPEGARLFGTPLWQPRRALAPRSPSASVFVFVCLYIGSAAACVAPSSVGLCTSVSGLKH